MNIEEMYVYYKFVLILSFISISCAKPTLVEGDIVLDRKLELIRSHHQDGRSKRSLFIKKKKTHEHKWKDGFVPYIISTDLSKTAKKAIKNAFFEIEKYTCIQFSPWNNEPNVIEFIKDEGCYSSIGRQNGRQVISIGIGCEFKNTVIHELLHSLGMFHEQTRLDRDLYVQVLWWNVIKGAEKNFDTYDHGIIDSLNFPYDYQSATHYFKKDYTKNGYNTLESIDKPSRTLGNRRGMSKIDVKKIYQYYRCYKKKNRPKKESCRDKISWCPSYTRHCNSKWFAESYCQKSCGTCVS